MATKAVHDDDPGDISCICGLLDADIEGILLGYGSDDTKDLEEELARECDKASLMNAREKIFELAKDKIIRCTSSERAGNKGDEPSDEDPLGGTTSISSFVGRWQLVPRRAEHKMVSDIIAMLEFTLGVDVTFPHGIIKEASMNRGNIETSGDTEELRKKLNKDVEAARGQVEIQVVEKRKNTQIHSISISLEADKAVEEPQEGDANPTGVIDSSDTDPPPEGHDKATNEVKDTEKPDDKEDEDQEDNTVSATPAPAPAKTDIDTRIVRLCTCPIGVSKIVKDMACQTDDERMVSRAEFDYHTDFTNRKIRINEQNIKGVHKWKGLVNNRLRDLENAHEREVIAIRAQYRSLSVEFAEMKRQKKQQQQKTQQKEMEKSREERMEMDEWEVNQDLSLESIWDITQEQSTPVTKTPNKKQNKQGKPQKSNQAASKEVVKSAAKVNNTPKGTTGKSARAKPAQNKQYTVGSNVYRVDIEMVEDTRETSQPMISSSSEEEEATQEEVRSNERVRNTKNTEGAANVTTRNKQSTHNSQEKRGATIAAENDVDMTDYDSSWAEMEEEPMLIDTTDNESARKDERGTDANAKKATNGRKVHFGREADARGVKRGEMASQEEEHSGESDKEGGSDKEESNDDEDAGDRSFSTVVSRNKWKKMRYDQKVGEREAAKKLNLKGIKSILQREVYVQGLDFRGFASHAEMEKLLYDYCVKRKITVIFMNIIPAKYDKETVGCKIAVKESDFEAVMEETFWPEDVTVREWRRKPRNAMGNEGYENFGH